jgi:hypothetical protein
MTKFCIELEDMALPDAIAAVVEAWLDAQSEEGIYDKKSNAPYQPGELIEFRDSASPISPWKRGWVVYKVYHRKIGICELSKWDERSCQPDYLMNGGDSKQIFWDHRKTGCALKHTQNIRKMILQPWEIEEARGIIG